MGKTAKKVLVHYFKVAVGQDPAKSNMADAKADLEAVDEVIDVQYVRSAMKTESEGEG